MLDPLTAPFADPARPAHRGDPASSAPPDPRLDPLLVVPHPRRPSSVGRAAREALDRTERRDRAALLARRRELMGLPAVSGSARPAR